LLRGAPLIHVSGAAFLEKLQSRGVPPRTGPARPGSVICIDILSVKSYKKGPNCACNGFGVFLEAMVMLIWETPDFVELLVNCECTAYAGVL
jgi:hypothetical protein